MLATLTLNVMKMILKMINSSYEIKKIMLHINVSKYVYAKGDY